MKKRNIIWSGLTILLLGIVGVTVGQNKSPKRGICGDASSRDMSVLSSSMTWYYNWGVAPQATLQDQLFGIEWVPMCWGGVNVQDVAGIESRVPAGSKYLLGFNEPNFKSQANLTPAQAAAMWPNVEKIAADKGLKLVSPAVNWCGDCVDGVTYDPTDWLDKFIAACPSCHFDYIAIHNYSPSASALQSYIDKFRKYNKPLWITEFAPWDPPKPDYDGVVKYMLEAIPILENDPIVFRYSWFATRVDINPDINILGDDGKLTKLGQLYANMAFKGLNTDLAPIAMAGADMDISLSSAGTTLKGNFYDANNDPATIVWTQVSGPTAAVISDPSISQPTVTGLIKGNYIFRMSVTCNGQTDVDDVTVSVGAADISRSKPVTASSVEGTGTPVTAVNDGNLSTRWSSAFSDPQWVQIDLESVYTLTGVKIVWESAASKNYEVQVSDNASTWTTVYTNTNGDGGTDKINFSATGRYVRVYSKARTTQWGNSIFEFEVYGSLVQTGIEDLEAFSLSVSPNPVKNGVIKIAFSGSWKDNNAQLSISNTAGQVVYSKHIVISSKDISVSTGLMKPGMYILTLKSKNQISQTKLVVE